MDLFENRAIWFFVFFAGTFLVSLFLSRVSARVSQRLKIVDLPDEPRKIHRFPVYKSGGISIFLSFVIGLLILTVLGGSDEISGIRLAGVVIGGAVLVIGGILDDKYDLSPGKQIWFPIVAALLVVLTGSHISYITSPLGGAIVLDQIKVLGYPIWGSLLVFLWILAITYTTKFLDGMDGLVTGISSIAGLAIFALSLAPEVNQTTTAFLALIFAASALGFLPFNFHPARLFLGEGGSTFTGFMIAVLAVISGAKIATALLVLGIPVLDAFWVIVQRLWFKRSPFRGDNRHLHFRLLDIGLSQRQAVLFLYLLSAVFGGVAVFLQSMGKLVALIILTVVMIGTIIGIAVAYRKKQQNV